MSQPAAAPNGQINALTSVRFLAAFSVLLAHFDRSLSTYLHEHLYDFIHTGGSAVFFFFVLSGFIMTHVYSSRDLRDKSARTKYYIARFARIAPLYYIALGLGLINVILGADKGATTAQWVVSILAKFTFLHAFIPSVVRFPEWAMVTWTLSVEFGFYVLFPFIAHRILQATKQQLWIIAAISVVYSGLMPHLAYIYTHETHRNTIWYLNASMYPGFFAMGMVASRLRHFYAESCRYHARQFFWFGAFCIMIVRFFPEPIFVSHCFHAAASALVIIGLCDLKKGPLLSFFDNPKMVLLGEASYALYLLHGPIGSALEKVKIDPKSNIVIFFFYAALSTAISIAAYKYIEIPARKWFVAKTAVKREKPKENASTN